MKKEELQKILEDIKSKKIAVIGDFCLDAYWFIDESKSEISVETGLYDQTCQATEILSRRCRKRHQ